MKCLIFFLVCALTAVSVTAQSPTDEANYGEVSPCVTYGYGGKTYHINRLCLATTLLDKTRVTSYHNSGYWAMTKYYYWTAAYLSPQNFLPDTGRWAELCSIWNNYFHCTMSRAACDFSAAHNGFMSRVHYPHHANTFHYYFYSRTCLGDTVKPSIQTRLSDPSYSFAHIDDVMRTCWNVHLSVMHAYPGWYKRPDAVAVHCMRKAMETDGASWSQATKDIAAHMVDLQRSNSMPRNIVSIDYASAERCTIAIYGRLHTLSCGATTMKTCQLYVPLYRTTYYVTMYHDRFLAIRGTYRTAEIREDLTVGPGNAGLITYDVRIGSRTSSSTLARYLTGTALPSTFTNGLQQAGSGDNMVRLVPGANEVEIFFDSLGIYVMIRQVIGGQYTIVVRMARTAALDGYMYCNRQRNRDTFLNGPPPTSVTLAQATTDCQSVSSTPFNINEVCIYDVFYTGQPKYIAEASQAYSDIIGADSNDLQLISLAEIFPIRGPWGPAIEWGPATEVAAPTIPIVKPSVLPSCTLQVPHVNSIYSDCHRMVYHLPVTSLDYMINNLLNSDTWTEHCRKEDEYGNCVLVWTDCTKADVTQMITDLHPGSVNYRYDPYDAFYNRTCVGIVIQAEWQKYLDSPQYNLNDLLNSEIPDCLIAYKSAFSANPMEPRDIILRILAVAYQCVKEIIVHSGWSNPTKKIAHHMSDLLTLPDTTPDELKHITSPYYDFSTPRCTMGVYGDPHIKTCHATSLTMCAAPGDQTYFENMFMLVTGTNSLVNFTPLTALTKLTIKFKSSKDPNGWIGVYEAENGMLPNTFTDPIGDPIGDEIKKGQDTIKLTYISSTHVEIVNIFLGVYINIRSSGPYYFFTMRMCETLADSTIGLIGLGCPAGQVVTIDDLFTNNKRSTSLESAKTMCMAKNLSEPFYRACVADVYRGRSDVFADMHKDGDADAEAAAEKDAEMMASAGTYDGSCVHRGKTSSGKSDGKRKDGPHRQDCME